MTSTWREFRMFVLVGIPLVMAIMNGVNVAGDMFSDNQRLPYSVREFVFWAFMFGLAVSFARDRRGGES